MSTDRLKREAMSIEAATLSNLREIAAIVEVLERKGKPYGLTNKFAIPKRRELP
jgi:hypothetical protein